MQVHGTDKYKGEITDWGIHRGFHNDLTWHDFSMDDDNDNDEDDGKDGQDAEEEDDGVDNGNEEDEENESIVELLIMTFRPSHSSINRTWNLIQLCWELQI